MPTSNTAVIPIPDTISEHQFAGLLRGGRTELANALSVPLQVPARAEIVLEGHIYPDDMAVTNLRHLQRRRDRHAQSAQ